MTKVALRVFRQLHDNLVESGVSRAGMNPAARDGYAALWLWMSGGQPIERLAVEDIGTIPDLRLDTAPIKRQAVGYVLPTDPRDWCVVARVAAEESIKLDTAAYAYPEPMLVWAGWRGERASILAGCVNLARTPTVVGLRLAPGRNYGEMGSVRLSQGDADQDLLMPGLCLRRFFAR